MSLKFSLNHQLNQSLKPLESHKDSQKENNKDSQSLQFSPLQLGLRLLLGEGSQFTPALRAKMLACSKKLSLLDKPRLQEDRVSNLMHPLTLKRCPMMSSV